ncbi:adenosylcobinamide-phosphate synthase CbiB [Bacillus sp. FJAT-47783]|uniref:adenosylcobinamide-phosphate synthase CbiB n=1 Tax=Bacillus sp. FJAT-47783 TaxID=2922712 RepID=UPI001FADFE79|nr:adenosylcobinamide-phosphate synthase CbiB [Bacillus sp. FJAT-47783]
MVNHLICIGLAYILDKVIGDPKSIPHPVRFFGAFISYFDKKWNKGSSKKWKGIWMILIVTIFFTLIAGGFVFVSYRLHVLFGLFIETVIITFMIAEKSLKEAAVEVYEPLARNDMAQARIKLSWIVGRDTDTLGEEEIVRGTVETVAENTSDAVTAPLFWTLIGGAPLAVFYRVANTADAMVGYRNEKYEQFGYASAKLDDLLNYIPSRLTAFVMIFVNRTSRAKKECFRLIRRDAKKHPSPNSGFPETAMAALLGVQLGGRNTYKGIVSTRAKLGDAIHALKANHIQRSVQIMERTNACFVLLLILGGGLIAMAVTWIKSSLFI